MGTPGLRPKVAIACQGGGSHAAFTAGVLAELLSPAHRDRFEPLAFSGTSGGAVCAALAWAGLLGGGQTTRSSAWKGSGATSRPPTRGRRW